LCDISAILRQLLLACLQQASSNASLNDENSQQKPFQKNDCRHTLGHSPECGALIADDLRDEYRVWVNRYGEIFEPDFLRTGATSVLVPWAFALYDFNNDGIPEVFITYVPRGHCGSFTTLYKFIDGEFRETPFVTSSGSWFFTDRAGRIVMFENCGRDGILQYSFFNLHDGGAEAELILQAEFCEETRVCRMGRTPPLPILALKSHDFRNAG
jgi:hypothetical protein